MKRLAIVAVLMGGCVVRQSTHDKAVAHIKELEAEVEAKKRAAAADEERIRDLNAAMEKERGEREAAAKTKEEELARVRGEKEATVAELEELRRQRDAQEQRLAAFEAVDFDETTLY